MLYSIPWVKKQIFEYEPELNSYNPRDVLVVADATFFGKRRDKFGVLVFKDVWSKNILMWKYIESEMIKDYTYLTNEFQGKGFIVKGVVIDGKKGLFKAFDAFPIQMCHFHQKMYPKGISCGHSATIYYKTSKTRSFQRFKENSVKINFNY